MSWVHRERERDESSGGGDDRGSVEILAVEGKRVERCGDTALRMSSRVDKLEKSSRGYENGIWISRVHITQAGASQGIYPFYL